MKHSLLLSASFALLACHQATQEERQAAPKPTPAAPLAMKIRTYDCPDTKFLSRLGLPGRYNRKQTRHRLNNWR